MYWQKYRFLYLSSELRTGEFRMTSVKRIGPIGLFVLLTLSLSLNQCKPRDVEIRGSKFTNGRGFCDVEFDLRNKLHVSIVAEVKLEALYLREGPKGSRTLESRGQEIIHVEVPAEETVHRIEKLKTTGRVGRVRVRLLRFSSK